MNRRGKSARRTGQCSQNDKLLELKLTLLNALLSVCYKVESDASWQSAKPPGGSHKMIINNPGDERDEYFRLMAEAMPHTVWTTDPLGQVTYLNQSWAAYTGFPVTESLGTGWALAIHPEDLDAVLKIRDQRYRHGLYRWHMVRALPLHDRMGNIIKYVGSFTDIHVARQSQVSLQDAVNLVEHKVKERTAELLRTNMELIDAIAQRRRAMSVYERDAQRLNEIISTQSLLMEATLDFDAFLNLAVQKIEHLTEASGAAFEMLEGDEFVCLAASGLLARHIGLRFRREGTLSGLCIRSRSVLTSGDTGTDSRVNTMLTEQIDAVSMVVAPLYCGGRSVGAVKIVSPGKNAFGARDVQTLRLMAGMIGSAIGQMSRTLATKKRSKQDATKPVKLKL
jgi:PAS domain S-box-containing protein